MADFATFAQTVGREAADGGPMYLYCQFHGAVASARPALVTLPVAVRQGGAVRADDRAGGRHATWVARIVVGVICGLGFGKSRVFGHADFDGNLNFDDYCGASEARIRWFHKQRLADVTCQTNAATFDWANQAMALSRAVLRPDMCGAIEAPVLLFQAGRDVWVLNGPQDDFVERVREGGGSIEKVRYSQSLHEIFSMPNAVLGSYLGKILDFLSAPNASLAE